MCSVQAKDGRDATKVPCGLGQIKARGGLAIAVAAADGAGAAARAGRVLPAPRLSELLDPASNVLPLQLLAYHAALARGCDLDRSRKLAKSVSAA